MRFVSSLFAFVVLGAIAGCGGNGPAKPVEMTAEQERQFQEAEKKVADEERRHQVEQGKSKALTPEQQVEMQERARQGR